MTSNNGGKLTYQNNKQKTVQKYFTNIIDVYSKKHEKNLILKVVTNY
jgi:hypothetical protein